ncbi:hypothetical protein CDAR_402661 [Caerostris darwini]|uniref:Uncharacterized protein n=1 Tax=Caerostris darwini TaxID=1538125 RepID=A0AAV4WQL3_9ARAC|nr:hypothetical protein CDAR_402661 [Caerostris darwini]
MEPQNVKQQNFNQRVTKVKSSSKCISKKKANMLHSWVLNKGSSSVQVSREDAVKQFLVPARNHKCCRSDFSKEDIISVDPKTEEDSNPVNQISEEEFIIVDYSSSDEESLDAADPNFEDPNSVKESINVVDQNSAKNDIYSNSEEEIINSMNPGFEMEDMNAADPFSRKKSINIVDSSSEEESICVSRFMFRKGNHIRCKFEY